MTIEENIFKRSIIEEDKLIKFGFKKENDKYVYEKEFMDFKTIITVENNNITGSVIDKETNEEYTNFRKKDLGEYTIKVKNEYENILKDIKEKCTKEKYFIYDQTNRITQYIKEKYNRTPLFLWEKDPNCGVFRKQEKWFGIIMNIEKNKITGKDNKEIEIINLKLDEETKEYIKQKGIYEAYHMSKKNWVTIILDDTLEDKYIKTLIDKSYNNVKE